MRVCFRATMFRWLPAQVTGADSAFAMHTDESYVLDIPEPAQGGHAVSALGRPAFATF